MSARNERHHITVKLWLNYKLFFYFAALFNKKGSKRCMQVFSTKSPTLDSLLQIIWRGRSYQKELKNIKKFNLRFKNIAIYNFL